MKKSNPFQLGKIVDKSNATIPDNTNLAPFPKDSIMNGDSSSGTSSNYNECSSYPKVRVSKKSNLKIFLKKFLIHKESQMKNLLICAAICFILLLPCTAITTATTAPSNDIATCSECSSYPKIKNDLLVFNNLTYLKEDTRGIGGIIWGERYRYDENKYIDVIYFGKMIWAYVIVNDRAAYDIEKCNPINYSLIDTDCDGIPDKKVPVCSASETYPDC